MYKLIKKNNYILIIKNKNIQGIFCLKYFYFYFLNNLLSKRKCYHLICDNFDIFNINYLDINKKYNKKSLKEPILHCKFI